MNDPDAGQEKRAFLAHMRHELRTPINAILGYGEMLLEDAQDGGRTERAADLEKVHQAGKRLLASVNELLDQKKIEAAGAAIDLKDFGVHIRHVLRTPLNDVVGYCEMLAEDAEDEVLVEDLGRIVVAARLLDSLIDRLIEASLAPAPANAAFEPVTISELARSTVESLRAPGDEPAIQGRVLVVDDNAVNRDILRRRLQRDGHEVVDVENGRQALDAAAADRFDLVLLDVMMPVLNGFETLERFQSDPALRNIPILMISALDELDSVVQCIEMGAEDFLAKPFDAVLLKARVDACLEKKRLRDREAIYLERIEREKQRSDDLLHVILPPEIVAELKATDRVAPRRHEGVAVLFGDIVGFTPYCDGRQPEEIVSSLQELVVAFEESSLKYDLQKIKTIGDAYMAAAGLLKPVENPVLNCVRCGLEMIAAAQSLSTHWNLRVGIHVGPVVAGVLGHRQYMYDLWGDAVNTAARMESHGVPGKITLSSDAWKCIEQLAIGAALGAIEVKGKGRLGMFQFDRFR